MEKKITKRVITIVFLSLATVILVLGFVNVNKLSKVKTKDVDTSFSVLFDKNSLNETTTGKTLTDKENTGISGTNITGRIALKEQGDSVIYTWDIINNGTADAKLEDVPVLLGLNNNDKLAIKSELFLNNKKAKKGFVIEKGETVNAKLVISYKMNSPTIIDPTSVQVVSTTLHFIQK